MPCGNVWWESFTPGVPSGIRYVCWEDGALDGLNEPPDIGNPASPVIDSKAETSAPPAFGVGAGDGSVVVGGDDPDIPELPYVGLNPGWNSGAHSVESVPRDWSGEISFDLPDHDGARQGGIAVGLALTSSIPAGGRNGYGHLLYGLVCTATYVRVIHAGQVVLEIPYAGLRALREPDIETDQVSALMYGAFIKWIVNGSTVWGGPFAMTGNYSLDATLFLSFDAVDNPDFAPGEWGDLEGSSLNGVFGPFAMTADASASTSLDLRMPGFAAQFSELVTWNLFGTMQGFGFTGGDRDGISAAMSPFGMVAADIANYTPLVGVMKPFGMEIGMGAPDSSVTYSVLSAPMPRFGMAMSFPPMARLDAVMSAFEMRASSEASYSELRATMRGFRFLGYGGEMTPLVQLVETIGARQPVYQSTHIALMFVERIDGSTEALAYATVTAKAMEQVEMTDTATLAATILQYAADLIGVGERALVMVRRVDGALQDDSEAWVVNTRTNASSRYDQYGFNSFATVRGRQFGMRNDGIYLLEGADDAGEPIKSGVHLGLHDFGTQQLKGIRAIYAGVSSKGCLLIRIGDGQKEWTYKAIRNDERMRTQRFDPGQGLESSYYTFELVSEADAFELDNVKFDIIASQRRI